MAAHNCSDFFTQNPDLLKEARSCSPSPPRLPLESAEEIAMTCLKTLPENFEDTAKDTIAFFKSIMAGQIRAPQFSAKEFYSVLRSEFEKQKLKFQCLNDNKNFEMACYAVFAMVNPFKPLQIAGKTAKVNQTLTSAAVAASKNLTLNQSLIKTLKLTSPLSAKTKLEAGEQMIVAEKRMAEALQKMTTKDLEREVRLSMVHGKNQNGYLPGLSPDWGPKDYDDLVENFKTAKKGSYLSNVTGNLNSYSGFTELLARPKNKDIPLDDSAKSAITAWEKNAWNAKVFSELEKRLSSN